MIAFVRSRVSTAARAITFGLAAAKWTSATKSSNNPHRIWLRRAALRDRSNPSIKCTIFRVMILITTAAIATSLSDAKSARTVHPRWGVPLPLGERRHASTSFLNGIIGSNMSLPTYLGM